MALLKAKIDRIRRAYPRGPTKYGQLYKARPKATARYKNVTLYTLFRSDENTHLLRPHIFAAKRGRTALQWSNWFSKELTDIHVKHVLPGLGIRTDKSWTVARIMGWVAGKAKGGTRGKPKNVVNESDNSAVAGEGDSSES